MKKVLCTLAWISTIIMIIPSGVAFSSSGITIASPFRTTQFIIGYKPDRIHRRTIHYSTLGNEDFEDLNNNDSDLSPEEREESEDHSISMLERFTQFIQPEQYKKLPPIQVEDQNLLFYDVFLIVNLSLSISFWVTHRLSFSYLPLAFNEGCLFSILWVLAGLYHGAFLMSAVDGHYGSTDERGGPKAAAALALNTYINTVNLRLLFALASAVIQHRQFGISPTEELIPLEIGCGIVLMALWRALHSYVTPRI